MRVSLPLYLLFMGSMILFSCKKPVLDENGTLPTDNLGLVFTDTLTVHTFTVLEDTLRADELATNVLGSVTDPVFGKTNASLYTEFTLPVSNMDLGDSLVLDSVVFSAHYSGSYGDVTVPQTLVVYRLNEQLNIDSVYFSNRTFAVQPAELARVTNWVPNLSDSITVNGVKEGPQLRIKLDNNLGQDLINQSGGGNFADNRLFQAYFSGLYITADTSAPGKGFVYLDLASAESRLSVYYNDTVVSFFVSSAAESLNNFTHNYNGSQVAAFLNSSSANGDSLIYTQSLAGTKGKIFVPYLRNLGNIAINKAELVFTVVSDSTTFGNPAKLIPNGVSETGDNALLPDQLVSSGYLGGTKYVENGLTKYKVNLARYYQGVLEGNEDSGIFIFPTPPSRIGDRVVLGGGTHSQYKVKLNLTYTKID